MADPPAPDAELTVEEHDWLHEELYRFNVAQTGIGDGALFSFARRDERGLLAAVFGHTWGGVMEIALLWVREDARHCGLGSALLRQAEEGARARGCVQVVLDTHSFQAPEFYQRHGYEIIGTIPDYPRGHQKHLLRKLLGGSVSVSS